MLRARPPFSPYSSIHIEAETNGCDFVADDIFKRIFFNENVWILIKISLKYVSDGPINNKSALVQVVAWRRTGDKPLPEAMMAQFTDLYLHHAASTS